MVMQFASLDLLVCSNPIGETRRDLGAAFRGGLGHATLAELKFDVGDAAMFELLYVSAKDTAGQGCADPIAAILSAALTLAWMRCEARGSMPCGRWATSSAKPAFGPRTSVGC